MDAHNRLATSVDQELDDVLCTLQLVGANESLQDHLFDDLVDLLVERLFVDLRARFAAGELSHPEYVSELSRLVASCSAVDLLTPSR